MTRSPLSELTLDRRIFLRSAALATAGLLLPGTAQARTPGGHTLRLPPPTGPHPLGVTTLYLVDRRRRDPWNAIAVREVMVSIHYPALSTHGHALARQLTPKAAGDFRQIDVPIHGLPSSGVDWAATPTHSASGAPAQPVRRPVLVYSPGGADPRTVGTSLAEELASHGHVVVTVDHPGDGSEVEFPVPRAGREIVRDTVIREDPRLHPRLFRTLIDTRIADLRFVLDQLAVLAAGRNPDAAGRPLPRHLGRALDLRRVGAYGHSAGGTSVAEAMHRDRRIAAAVNLEGYLDQPSGELFPVAREGTDRPLLLLGTDGFEGQPYERSWAAVLARSHGHARRAPRLEHARHWVFTDYAALAPQLQAAGLMSPASRDKLVGTIDPARSVPAVRARVRSFFTRHLA
ncbi:alpha/beta hydrolase family protein [Streptomyces orinoci]|uniref:Alpha/beta hydrolase n=1 Tax=Streptomyces orinoci TaxID=67339 RepID=A0ABV3K487_STRON|nr:alpha/beta hydrolase [Streptomyces orinoci]